MPRQYRALFARCENLLRSHRGFDIGALAIGSVLAGELAAPLIAATVTRLLIDLNRSIGHPALYSEITRSLPVSERLAIRASYYDPHRTRVVEFVDSAATRSRSIVHIASHSFTPVLDGVVRTADVGFLYDPKRPGEAALAARWFAHLKRLRPDLRLRRNYPYFGDSDGLARMLRRRHPPAAYVGIELEVNQALLQQRGVAADQLALDLARSLHQSLQE